MFKKKYINTERKENKREREGEIEREEVSEIQLRMVIFPLEIQPTDVGANSTNSSVISFYSGLRNVYLSKR